MKRWVALMLLCLLSLPAGSVAGTITGQFHGVGYSPYHLDGQDPDLYSLILSSQIQDDLGMIDGVNKFIHVRTFALDNGLDQVPDIAKKDFPRLRIWLGVYESSVDHDNPNNTHATRWQLDRAIELAKAYDNVVGIVVGDECLKDDQRAANHWITVRQLLDDLAYVSQQLQAAGIRDRVVLTTDLSWAAAHGDTSDPNGNIRTQLLAEPQNIDTWMINIYPFYAGPPPPDPLRGIECTEKAIRDNLDWNYNEFNGIYGYTHKSIMIGEHGWPTSGDDYGKSHPSVPNQRLYFRVTSKWLREKNWSAFYFEMFDEPWKEKSNEPGGIGPHWGLCYSNDVHKWSLTETEAAILKLLLLD
jgi:exo-beta-1,3-glucanase (GH17 family)